MLNHWNKKRRTLACIGGTYGGSFFVHMEHRHIFLPIGIIAYADHEINMLRLCKSVIFPPFVLKMSQNHISKSTRTSRNALKSTLSRLHGINILLSFLLRNNVLWLVSSYTKNPLFSRISSVSTQNNISSDRVYYLLSTLSWKLIIFLAYLFIFIHISICIIQ